MNANYKKIIIGVIILLGILLIAQKCNNNRYNQLKGKYEILEEQYKKQKDCVKVFEENRIKEKDSLDLEIKKREKLNKDLSYQNSTLESKIKTLSNKKIVVPKDVQGLVKYFNERYKTNENKVVENKVGLTEFTAMDVSYELEEGDNLIAIDSMKTIQLKNKDTQIINLEKDKADIKTQLTTAEEDILRRKELQQSADENINNLKSQVKSLKTKSTLNKILVPVALGVGVFTGYQIAK